MDVNMNNSKVDTDILIVGAGPVGLFLANECARRGLKWQLVEQRSSQSEHSKALAIFPRTLEIFDMAGVVDPFLKVANRVTSVAVIEGQHRLAHMQFEPEHTPYPFVAMVPQDVTERLLVQELQAHGGQVEYNTSFTSGVEHEDHVTATLERNGQRHEVSSKYLVGCDGAHSTVRHLLNLPFEGAEYSDSFILADVETNDALPADELQLCPSEFGPVAIFPMSASRRRVVATVDRIEGDAPSLELVQQILGQRGPVGFEASALRWSSYFRIHHRQAAKLRVGRMFIAGDAAHIHSPFGGQGMNTGLHDVWNLVWKLDMALRGRATEDLLESYTAERRPVIKQVIETTDFLTKVMGTPNKLAQVLRNTVIPMVSRLAPFQHAFVRRLSELGITYHGSAIVDGAGERFFEDSVRGGSSLRSRFLLLVDKDAPSSEAAKELADAFVDVVEFRTTEQKGIVLVRPDGYVAYTSNSLNGAGEIQAARQILERQVTSNLQSTRAA
jgi:2-polyprenyl-6-methoxyphenol hydroxylase-like FAD-dependent oxidoreductase